MPHQTHERKFGRTTDQRIAMLRNLTMSVLRYERVKTTETKAKEVRGFVDRMINLGKDGSLEARRSAIGWIPEAVIVEKVFTDLKDRYPDRPGGYTRITRLGHRVGDNSQLALVELMPGVDETKKAEGAEEKPKSRRRLPSLRRRPAAEKADEAASEEKPAAKKTTTAAKKTTRKKTTAKA